MGIIIKIEERDDISKIDRVGIFCLPHENANEDNQLYVILEIWNCRSLTEMV